MDVSLFNSEVQADINERIEHLSESTQCLLVILLEIKTKVLGEDVLIL